MGDRKGRWVPYWAFQSPLSSLHLSPVLSETQQQLLANALDTMVLSKQLELVRGHGMGDAMGLWVHPEKLTGSSPASQGLRLQFLHLQPLSVPYR